MSFPTSKTAVSTRQVFLIYHLSKILHEEQLHNLHNTNYT